MKEQTVLDRLMEAFPSEYIGESTTDHRFRFAPRAMIWVRKSNLNLARIEITHMSNYLSNFPNKDELRKVINNPASTAFNATKLRPRMSVCLGRTT